MFECFFCIFVCYSIYLSLLVCIFFVSFLHFLIFSLFFYWFCMFLLSIFLYLCMLFYSICILLFSNCFWFCLLLFVLFFHLFFIFSLSSLRSSPQGSSVRGDLMGIRIFFSCYFSLLIRLAGTPDHRLLCPREESCRMVVLSSRSDPYLAYFTTFSVSWKCSQVSAIATHCFYWFYWRSINF